LQSDLRFVISNPTSISSFFQWWMRAPEYIREDKDLIRVTKHFFESGKPIASVVIASENPRPGRLFEARRMADGSAKMPIRLEVCRRHLRR